MELVLFTANSAGNEKNCSYPNKTVINNADQLKEAVRFDHVCAEYKNSYRNNGNFIRSTVVVMDCDNDHSENPEDWITPEALKEEFSDVAFAITFSRHHMKVKDGKTARPKFHVYFQIPEITDPESYASLKHKIYEAYPFFDGNALDAGRFIFGCVSEDVVWHDGRLTIDQFLIQNSTQRVIQQGSRNSTMSRFAGRVVKRYGWNENSYQIFLEEAEKCDPPLEQNELDHIWNSAKKFAKVVEKQPGYISPEKYNESIPKGPAGSLKPKDYSDIGEAKVLNMEYGNELKFNPATDYLRYNGIYWNESKEAATGATEEFLDLQLADARLLAFEKAEELKNAGADPTVIKAGGKRAVSALNDAQLKLYMEYVEATQYLTFVMKRRDYKYIKSTLDTLKPMVSVEFEDLDRQEFLMNTPEATYDLRLGMAGRREHKAEDLLTKVTLVEPGDTGEDLWNETLQKTFLGDQELIDYVQKVVGLSAIGKVYVEALIIAYGGGKNGKSTFWNTIARVMGTYSGNLSADTLTVGCKRNVKPEMAETKGKRLIIAAELEEGTRLNTSVVKQLCSTDPIFAEKKYKAPASFIPSHTVVLYTNHLPRVGATDDGTWRRLIVIPFNAKFEGKNDTKNYTDVLLEKAGPAILKWIIEGAQKVIQDGFHLTHPTVVKEAIEEYREQNDWLSAFIDDCCVVDPAYKEKAGELYAEYREYSIRMGEFTRGNSDFYAALEQAGYSRHKFKTGVIVYGLRLKTAFDDNAEKHDN